MGIFKVPLGVLVCLVGLLFLWNGIISFNIIDSVLGLILGILVIVIGIKLIKKSSSDASVA
jgi:divalent metal cation (Fe/Co/Zn/Cd) transporter